MRITLQHLAGVRGFGAKPGLCRRDARKWFARHNLDWDTFRREGIEADVVEGIDDPFAQAVLAHAKEQEAARGRQ